MEKYDGLRKHSSEINQLVRDCLKSALLKLINEKACKEISVTELCKKAGVSRMAFYRNYQVMNDLFRELAVDLNNMIIDSIGSPFRSTTMKEWYANAFHTIYENRDSIAIMYQENFQFEWMKIVNSLAIHDPAFSAEEKYQRLIWCGGFENIVSHWLNTGTQESPEEMSLYCERYLANITIEKQ